jgi:C1A family cysteine protease
MTSAFRYVKSNPLETDKVYPYKEADSPFPITEKCKDKGTGSGKVKSCTDVTPMSSAALKASIAKGPVSIGVDADKMVFSNYNGGVITSASCGTEIDHGILAVGYGTDPNYGDYFLCKNSWGGAWGDGGYLKIAATDDNICGILGKPSYPNV